MSFLDAKLTIVHANVFSSIATTVFYLHNQSILCLFGHHQFIILIFQEFKVKKLLGSLFV